MEKIMRLINNFNIKSDTEIEIKYENEIRDLFMKFSFEEVMSFLYVIFGFQKNRSLHSGHFKSYTIINSIDRHRFKKNKQVKYGNFINFFNKLKGYLESDPILDDFIPEISDKDIFFNYYGNEYKTYLDGSFSFHYQYYDLAKTLFGENAELKECFLLNNLELEEGISEEEREVITRGSLHLPSESYFKKKLQILNYINNEDFRYNINKKVNKKIKPFGDYIYESNFIEKKGKKFLVASPNRVQNYYYDNIGSLNVGSIEILENLSTYIFNKLSGVELEIENLEDELYLVLNDKKEKIILRITNDPLKDFHQNLTADYLINLRLPKLEFESFEINNFRNFHFVNLEEFLGLLDYFENFEKFCSYIKYSLKTHKGISLYGLDQYISTKTNSMPGNTLLFTDPRTSEYLIEKIKTNKKTETIENFYERESNEWLFELDGIEFNDEVLTGNEAKKIFQKGRLYLIEKLEKLLQEEGLNPIDVLKEINRVVLETGNDFTELNPLIYLLELGLGNDALDLKRGSDNFGLLKSLAKKIIELNNRFNSINYSLIDEVTYKLTIFGTLETYFENNDIIEKWNDFEQKEIEKWRDISVNYDILEKHVHKLYEIQINEEGFSTEDILMVLRILLELEKSSNIIIKNKQSIIKEFDFNPYIPKERLIKALDFLILTNQNVKELIENKSIVKKDFIPIGEIKKRPSRYNLKPLILLKGDTIAYEKSSLSRTANVWARAFLNAKYPFVSLNENINNAIKDYQKEIQDYLANEVEEVLLSINQNMKIFKETHFYKLDKIGKYKRSDEVGDYDILAFDLDKNIIFNIECKYGSQPFNAKEAKNAKNDFLKKKKGYKVKFEKRIEYLEKEANNLLKNMYDIESEFEIVNIYLPYTLNMYHFFESETQNKIKYMTKNMLRDYVIELYS